MCAEGWAVFEFVEFDGWQVTEYFLSLLVLAEAGRLRVPLGKEAPLVLVGVGSDGECRVALALALEACVWFEEEHSFFILVYYHSNIITRFRPAPTRRNRTHLVRDYCGWVTV